jgi:hypothetical protein
VRRLAVDKWTYVGIQTFPGCCVLLLVNGPDKSTRALVVYSIAQPVRISELS